MADPGAAHKATGRLAEVFAQVLAKHAPHGARIDAETRQVYLERWLDQLEQHTAKQVGPFLRKVLESTDVPDEFRHLLEEAIDPPAAFSSIIEQIVLWGIVQNIIGAATTPFVQSILNTMWTEAVNAGGGMPLAPASIATAVGRGLNLGDQPTVAVPGWAHDQAAQSGMSADQINLMASLVGLPPALQELFELYRRGDISLDQVKQGLREGDFRDDWIEKTLGLAHALLQPGDFVRAAVQSQLPYSVARDFAKMTGLDVERNVPIDIAGGEATADMFGLAFSIAGRPPGPAELARAANRGLIPWTGTGSSSTTFQQGVAESDVKTKWTDVLQQLAVYVPPPRTVGTLLSHGGITKDQAIAYWNAGGVPTGLAEAYAYQTEQQHVSQSKLEAKTTVLTAYYDRIIDREQAKPLLADLGYEGHVADEMLAVEDFRWEISAMARVVSKVETLYGAHKLTATDAKTALEDAGVSSAQADRLLGYWEALRSAPVRLPTPSEIGSAVHYGTITQEVALEEMAKLGYQPRDAAIVLSAHSHVQITPLPKAGTTITG